MAYIRSQQNDFGYFNGQPNQLGEFGFFKRAFKAVASGGMSELHRARKKIGKGMKRFAKGSLRVGAALATGGMSEVAYRAIKEERRKKGVPMNAPISQAEIDAAERAEKEKEKIEKEAAKARDEEMAELRTKAADERLALRKEIAEMAATPTGPTAAEQQMMQQMQMQMQEMRSQAGGGSTKILIGIGLLAAVGLVIMLATGKKKKKAEDDEPVKAEVEPVVEEEYEEVEE
jgi:hypothetical protein